MIVHPLRIPCKWGRHRDYQTHRPEYFMSHGCRGTRMLHATDRAIHEPLGMNRGAQGWAASGCLRGFGCRTSGGVHPELLRKAPLYEQV